MSCCQTVPGEISYDDILSAADSLKISLGPKETESVRSCIKRRFYEILPYNLFSSSCVDFVRECLAAGGISVNDNLWPSSTFGDLRNIYGK